MLLLKNRKLVKIYINLIFLKKVKKEVNKINFICFLIAIYRILNSKLF